MKKPLFIVPIFLFFITILLILNCGSSSFWKDKNNYYKEREESDIITKAKEDSVNIITNAKRVADGIIKEAKFKADTIINEAKKFDSDIKNKELITKLEEKVKKIPVSKYKENLDIYKQLSELAPKNKRYKDKIAFYENKIKESKRKKVISNEILDKVKGEEKLTVLSDFESALKSKFAGSSEAELLSLKIMSKNLVISAKHRRCDYYDTIFIDVGVAGYRSSNIKELNFSKVILELHCDANRINKYYVYKSEFLKYLNLSINDPKFLALIKRM